MKENALSILDLRDIVVPAPAAFWPPAPFLWILIGAAGLGLVLLIWRGVARWKSEAYRREGLMCLTRIEKQFMSPGSNVAALKELSVLLKRVALAAFPRKAVASLYGEKWLRFLDQTCAGCMFSTGPGHLLAEAIFSEVDVSLSKTGEARQLVREVRTWIKGHSRETTNQSGQATLV